MWKDMLQISLIAINDFFNIIVSVIVDNCIAISMYCNLQERVVSFATGKICCATLSLVFRVVNYYVFAG